MINEEQEKHRLRRYNIKLMELPEELKNLQDKYGDKDKVNLLANESLFIYGIPGTGKTVLATFILKYLWWNGKSAKYMFYPDFISDIQKNWEESEEIFDKFRYFGGCLLIDEFGYANLSDFVKLTSYRLIDYREKNGLQTIITCNYDLKWIANNVDERTASRISGMCEILHLKGKDRRIK